MQTIGPFPRFQLDGPAYLCGYISPFAEVNILEVMRHPEFDYDIQFIITIRAYDGEMSGKKVITEVIFNDESVKTEPDIKELILAGKARVRRLMLATLKERQLEKEGEKIAV